jgi:DNA-3-methyladenine glycosylase
MSEQFQPLPESFYEPSAAKVAPALLGHLLIHKMPEGICGGAIVEAEAYLSDDPACHGYARQTDRNKTMYGPPGRAYVYFIYGNHYCVNAVCQRAGVAEAVLIRAIEPLFGLELMREHRRISRELDLTNGPGKLCEAMGIKRQQDGLNLCDTESPLIIARNPSLQKFRRARAPVITTTRVGINKAADLPLRFYLAGSPYVSRRAKEAEKQII